MSVLLTPSTRPPLSRRLQALVPSPTIAVNARASALTRQGVHVLNLALGEPDFDTPAHIKAAAEQAIRDGKTKYTSASGVPELKEAVCQKFARENGVEYEPAETAICVGGKQVLYNIMLAICNPGDEVLVPVPNWPTFADQVALADGKAVHVPLPADHKLRAQDVEPHLSPRTRAIILNSPSNPTGAVMRPEDVRAVTELAVDRGIYIISDETYEHFLYDGATHLAPASLGPEAKAWTIEVSTVSKTYAMTGWRIGYVAGPKEIVAAIDNLMGQTTNNPCSISQWAAVAALSGPQDCVREMVAEFARRRQSFVSGLNRLGYRCQWPEGAFYAYPRVPAVTSETGVAPETAATAVAKPRGDSLTFATRLLEQAHISGVPARGFFDEGSIRLSYAASTAVLDEALARLKAFQ